MAIALTTQSPTPPLKPAACLPPSLGQKPRAWLADKLDLMKEFKKLNTGYGLLDVLIPQGKNGLVLRQIHSSLKLS